ncbi:MAG: biotin/lipoyl-binding protein, partial [Bryobacteraceae bacterium]
MPPTGLLPPNIDVDSKRAAELPPAAEALAPVIPDPPKARVPAHSNRKKWWLAVTLVVVAAAMGVYYFRGSAEPAYQTAVIDRGDIQAAITATGAVNAVKTVQVGSQVSGNIIALYADFNTKVKKGQLVARIDPAIFQARVDQSNAVLESAKASVVSARASIARAAADIAAAQANVASQKANLVRAQSAVTDAKLKNERRI